ncbi:hypothetical protein BaRGS_00039238 [Batillaria attramentaria]|uniref:DDE Tnp4 domain-containing protein n=1 Tax=Batillaria attramentaria TaxID=370345 RepID=A0ABD0J487_9CAEN
MASYDSSSEEEEENFAGMCAAAAVLAQQRQSTNRSTWVRPWLARRLLHGAYSQLLQEFFREDPRETKRFLRMSQENFRELLEMVGPVIKKQDTRMRKAIEPGERLAITLRYLASGDSFVSLSYAFRVANNTIREIVLETCTALFAVLKDEYLKVPSTPDEWERISNEFQTRWQFPNCVGALDGKHVEIVSPGRGSAYFNYQGYHSIVLMALVDAAYRIIWFDVGCNGRAGDAGIFRDSSLAEALEKDTLGLPPPRPLPGRTEPVPFFIVGDDAFGLKTYLMKPYPYRTTVRTTGRNDDPVEIERRQQRLFDYRLSRARRLSENVFGILAARFGVFRSAMRLSPENATTVTLACLALHNFLFTKRDVQFAAPSLPDREHPLTHELVDGEWRSNRETSFHDLTRQAGNRNTADARWVREEIKDYVNSAGAVPWQERIAFGRNLQ